jgi:hypothetical protein
MRCSEPGLSVAVAIVASRAISVLVSAGEDKQERTATVCPPGTFLCRKEHGFPNADGWLAVMPARMAETEVAVVYVIHLCDTPSVLRQPCFHVQFAVSVSSVKTVSFNEVKRQEAQSRMAAMRRARRSPAAAAAQQRRASLVGDGAKWRITNFKQVARAMSKWA